MTERELWWLAGLFEGEGSANTYRAHGYDRLQTVIDMRDEDVLQRVASLAGGTVFGPYQYKPEHSPIWKWQLTGSKARALLITLYPLLGARRRQQIVHALNIYAQSRARGKAAQNAALAENRRRLAATRNPVTGRYNGATIEKNRTE